LIDGVRHDVSSVARRLSHLSSCEHGCKPSWPAMANELSISLLVTSLPSSLVSSLPSSPSTLRSICMILPLRKSTNVSRCLCLMSLDICFCLMSYMYASVLDVCLCLRCMLLSDMYVYVLHVCLCLRCMSMSYMYASVSCPMPYVSRCFTHLKSRLT